MAKTTKTTTKSIACTSPAQQASVMPAGSSVPTVPAPQWPGIKRFEIYWVDLDPITGAEKNNGFDHTGAPRPTRPCIIVQNDVGNASPGNLLTIVVPLTDTEQWSKLPVQVFIPKRELGDTKDGVAECGHIRTIDRSRIKDGPLPWVLSDATKAEIDQKLGVSLGMSVQKPVRKREPRVPRM